MKFSTILVFLFAIVCSSSVFGFKVLGIITFESKSHFAIGNSIIESLHEAGHEVTVISPYPKKNKVPNHHDVSTQDIMEKRLKGFE